MTRPTDPASLYVGMTTETRNRHQSGSEADSKIREAAQVKIKSLQAAHNAAIEAAETQPLEPSYPYDVSKANADMAALSYAKSYQMVVAVTRSCNFYGPGDLHCRVVARSNDHLQEVINRMLEVEGIARSTTVIALSDQVHFRAIPLVAAAVRDR